MVISIDSGHMFMHFQAFMTGTDSLGRFEPGKLPKTHVVKIQAYTNYSVVDIKTLSACGGRTATRSLTLLSYAIGLCMAPWLSRAPRQFVLEEALYKL